MEPTDTTTEPGRRIKRSLILDRDMVAWIECKARAESASESFIVRRYLRAAMNAELMDDRDVEQ